MVSRTRTQSIRTAGALVETSDLPVSPRIARRAQCLRVLGLSAWVIAARLGVTDKTVVKAIARLRNAVLG